MKYTCLKNKLFDPVSQWLHEHTKPSILPNPTILYVNGSLFLDCGFPDPGFTWEFCQNATTDSGFLVFWPKEECSIKEKLYFFPKIEFGNSTDVLATNSNTVVMAEKSVLLFQTSTLGCAKEMKHRLKEWPFGAEFLSLSEKSSSPFYRGQLSWLFLSLQDPQRQQSKGKSWRVQATCLWEKSGYTRIRAIRSCSQLKLRLLYWTHKSLPWDKSLSGPPDKTPKLEEAKDNGYVFLSCSIVCNWAAQDSKCQLDSQNSVTFHQVATPLSFRSQPGNCSISAYFPLTKISHVANIGSWLFPFAYLEFCDCEQKENQCRRQSGVCHTCQTISFHGRWVVRRCNLLPYKAFVVPMPPKTLYISDPHASLIHWPAKEWVKEQSCSPCEQLCGNSWPDV